MTTYYAWCFSHGRLHLFAEPEGPWCTAGWVRLTGGFEEEALADKQTRFGDAQFLHHLPNDQQVAIILGDDKETS